MDDVMIAPVRHRLSVDAYYRIIGAGIFGQEDRIELIEGDMIDMAPRSQGHEANVAGLTEALVLACAGRAIVWPQNSIRLDRSSAPQPDLAVLRRRADFYGTGDRAGPDDVLLLVEVADSSLTYDRSVKLALYARAGIAEYWIVDLKRRAVDVHRRPAGESYGETTTYQAGGRVALLLMPEIVVTLDLVFG